MGGYRDDLGAAVARADALQRRVDELEAVEGRFALAQAELRELRKLVPKPAAGRASNAGAFVTLGLVLLCLAAGVLLVFGSALLPQGRTVDHPPVYLTFGR